MDEKQTQLQLVQHAIDELESKEQLSGKDLKDHTELVALREKIKGKDYKVNWDGFWAIISRMLPGIAIEFIRKLNE